MKKEHSEEIQRALKKCVDYFEKEDRAVRERQIRTWKKLKYYWSGFQRVWWSDTAHDWRVWNVATETDTATSSDAGYYDKMINVFRAYLESIIAALSITIPPVCCYPDDADNNADIQTARAGDKIASLVFKHNNVSNLWLRSLFVYCTEGMIAAYNYTKCDKKYGTYKKDQYRDEYDEGEFAICPVCEARLGDEKLSEAKRNTFGPGNEDTFSDGALNTGDICMECGLNIIPELRKGKFLVRRLIDQTDEPKARQCIDVYGGLYVKVPIYAREQKDIPYLIFSYETHYSNVLAKYGNLRDKFGPDAVTSVSNSAYESYDRWGRMSTQYGGQSPTDTPTVRNTWLRNSAFNILPEDECKMLQKEFPDGAKVVFINDEYAEACNENLDDCWTLSINPLSDYLYFDPIGMFLTSIQDITNDIDSLIRQTIEHGIPQTFADPQVLNFDQYSQQEVAPGMIYPAKPASGKSVSDAFYEVKTAQLSGEVMPYAEKVQQMGQLVSGALPSLFGGAQPNSSKTAAQYAMSRSQAQQRLQNTWKMLTIWWKDIFAKVIPAYIKDVVEDERDVVRDSSGNFINVFIRRAELQGKIGSVELEANENLPVSWLQKKDVIMQLLQAANPQVMEMLSDPRNLPLVRQAIGLEDFVVPGEDDRNNQYEEIKILSETGPVLSGDGMREMPSVNVEPLLDDHEIHIDICQSWLKSEGGRLAKIENEAGYKNVLLHMQEHMMAMQAMMQMFAANQASQQPQQQQQGRNKEGRPKPAAQQVKRDASTSSVN